MRTPEDLWAGYRRFRAGAFSEQVALYEALDHGQDPDIMLIACADSRVEPAEIFAAAPGQLFVVRNVANLVPPYDPSGGLHGVSAAIEYAVTGLNVEHIVVMGHGGCGGIAASLAAARSAPFGEFVAPWVSLLGPTRDEVLASHPDDAQTALEHAAVGQSLENLMTFPFVRKRVEAGQLQLHGSWFAIGVGELHWREADSGEFRVLDPGPDPIRVPR